MSTDVLISMDTTGSMSPCLAEVRRKVSEFIERLFNQVDDLRIGIIAHGDYCDHNMYTAHPLSDNKASLIKFVQTVSNTGGGDTPEAYEYVLNKAYTDFNWSADNRAFILIGDCNPHYVGYTYGRVTNTLDWKEEAKQCIIHGIKIYPVQALNRTEHNSFYDGLASISGTVKLPLNQFMNIVPLLTAVIFSQQGNDLVQQYGDELDLAGGMNRGIAEIFNLILGEDKYDVKYTAPNYSDDRRTYDYHSSSAYGRGTHDLADGLNEVDPARFQVLHVDRNQDIKSFVNDTGALFKIGRGFYELTKPEEVQERKEVVLVHKRTGDMYSGKVARDMIGLPFGERGKVRPKYGFDYDVFIQSTSANRKLMGGTKFLYEAK